MNRVETGPLQFGDDWPGVFIRGDNALMGYAPALQKLIDGQASAMEMAMCKSLLNLLKQAGTQEKDTIQLLQDPVQMKVEDNAAPKYYEAKRRSGGQSAYISVQHPDGRHFQCNYHGDLDDGPKTSLDFGVEPPEWVVTLLNLKG